MRFSKIMILFLILIGIIALVGYVALRDKPAKPASHEASQQSTTPTRAISYLPLGDSYTIGQSVSENERWPNQLVARLQADDIQLKIVTNPSVTGYTTQDLIDQELPLVAKLKPQFVTILIGVNDYVQGVPLATFQDHLNYIVKTVQQSLANPKNIVLVTIPDFSKTPTGAEFGPPAQSENGIIEFNAIITKTAQQFGLAVADIFPVSQQVADDSSLIASDGLHPSGKEYTAWTNIIYQTITESGLLTPAQK